MLVEYSDILRMPVIIEDMSMKSDNLRAYIDASGVKPGQNNVTINFTPPSAFFVMLFAAVFLREVIPKNAFVPLVVINNFRTGISISKFWGSCPMIHIQRHLLVN